MRDKPWPKSRDELRAAGYGFRTKAVCRSMDCRKNIEMWVTPNGRVMPLIVIETAENYGDDKLQAHFADCVDAKKFRKVQR